NGPSSFFNFFECFAQKYAYISNKKYKWMVPSVGLLKSNCIARLKPDRDVSPSMMVGGVIFTKEPFSDITVKSFPANILPNSPVNEESIGPSRTIPNIFSPIV